MHVSKILGMINPFIELRSQLSATRNQLQFMEERLKKLENKIQISEIESAKEIAKLQTTLGFVTKELNQAKEQIMQDKLLELLSEEDFQRKLKREFEARQKLNIEILSEEDS